MQKEEPSNNNKPTDDPGSPTDVKPDPLLVDYEMRGLKVKIVRKEGDADGRGQRED